MPQLSAHRLQDRLKRIKVVLMDVDGVLTDGRIYHFVDPHAGLVEFKGIHSQDSIALAWLSQMGLKTGIISGRVSAGVGRRMKELGVTYIFQHRLDKKNVFHAICSKERVLPEETLYIGDDLPDLPVLRAAGVAVAVRDARPEVRIAAHWVTRAKGGAGAVREVAEKLLKKQGLWDRVLKRYPGV